MTKVPLTAPQALHRSYAPFFGLDDTATGAERADRRLDARRPFDAVQPLGIEQPQHPHVAQILFEGLQ